jgi:hypothetical protein
MFKRILTILAVAATSPSWAYSVNAGKIYNDAGAPVTIKGVNWFGFETTNYTVHGLWQVNWHDQIALMKKQGFNAVRLPVCPTTLKGITPVSIDYSINPDLVGLNSSQLIDTVVKELSAQGMMILLDHHNPDCKTISELWYTSSYSETQWINDLKSLATRYRELPGFLGIDLKNEPHGSATWGAGNSATDWNKAAERAAAAKRQAEEEARHQAEEEARRKAEEEARKVAEARMLTEYRVGGNDNLASIAALVGVYGDPLLWPLLYQANRDQIKDPAQIYVGQVLRIPRGLPSGELEFARQKAREAGLFGIGSGNGGKVPPPR